MKILQKFHSDSSFVDTLLGVWIMKNDREKICEERNVARIGEKIVQIQTPNLYDPSFNSLSLAISSAILHEITIIFSFSPVPMFPFSRSLGATRSIDGKMFVNTETERKSGHASHVSF